MYYQVEYEFKNGKHGSVPFFHLSRLLGWHDKMREMLASVIVGVYVDNQLFEKFVWNT